MQRGTKETNSLLRASWNKDVKEGLGKIMHVQVIEVYFVEMVELLYFYRFAMLSRRTKHLSIKFYSRK